jgi:hypothetical protein
MKLKLRDDYKKQRAKETKTALDHGNKLANTEAIDTIPPNAVYGAHDSVPGALKLGAESIRGNPDEGKNYARRTKV